MPRMRDSLSAVLKADMRFRLRMARQMPNFEDKVATLLRLERGSDTARRYVQSCLDARELYRRKCTPNVRGRPRMKFRWQDLIELAAAIFRDSNRPMTSHRYGAFVEFMYVVYGVVPPKAEIIAFLRRSRAR